MPAAGLQQRDEARAVGARLGAEDAGGRAPPRRVLAELGHEAVAIGQGVLAHVVALDRLVEPGDQRHGVVEQGHERREGVAEEARDAHGDVDPRAPELVERHGLEPDHAARLGVPDRAHAEQREDLARVVAVGAHRRRAPHDDPDRLGVRAVLVEVAAQQRVGQPAPDVEGEVAGQRLGIDRVEVAPGRQDVDAPAGRRPRRPRRDVAPAQAAEQVVELVGRRPQPRHDLLAGEAQRGHDAGVLVAEDLGAGRGSRLGGVAARPEGADQRALRVVQAVDEVGAAGRRAGEARQQRRRRVDHHGARVLEQRRLVEAVGGADRAPQPGHALARSQAQDGRQQAVELLALGRGAEDVQAVADLEVLDLAQVAVDVLDERAEVLERRLLGLLEVEVVVQLGLVQQGPDASGERRQLGRVERLAARVLVEELLELGQLVVGLGAHHRAPRGGRRSRRSRGAWPARPRRGRRRRRGRRAARRPARRRARSRDRARGPCPAATRACRACRDG